jgi:hypothetical protein
MTAGFPKVGMNRIGRNTKEPSAEVCIVTPELAEPFQSKGKDRCRHVFGTRPIKQPVHAVPENPIVMSTVQHGKRLRILQGLLHQ